MVRRKRAGCVAGSIALVLAAAALAGCGDERSANVRPPALGVPAHGDDVVGIYKTLGQNTLQLRADGSLVVVAGDIGAIAGTFTVDDGRLEVRTPECATPGGYEVRVTGEREPNKARLEMRALDDSCASRRQALTRERWTYVES